MFASVLRPRVLGGLAALAAALCLVVHLVDPGLLFPLQAVPWGIGVVLLAALGAPLPELARPLVAVAAAGALLSGGLPATHNATFPWIELGRGRPDEFEDAAVLGLCAAAALATIPPSRGRPARRWMQVTLATIAALALAAALIYPAKATLQVLGPAGEQIMTVPVLRGAGVTPMRWSRVTTQGPGIQLLPAMVRDEWALMDIAAGIHQEAAPSALRRGLWLGLEGVAALAWLLRVAALPAALLALRLPALGRIPGLALLIVPAANLAATVPGLLLADDRAMRPAAIVSALTTLLVYGAIARGSR